MACRLQVQASQNGCYILRCAYNKTADENDYTLVCGPFSDTIAAERYLESTPQPKEVTASTQLWWLEDCLWYPVNGSVWDIIPHIEFPEGFFQLSVWEQTKINPALKSAGFTPLSWQYGAHVMPVTREVTCMRDMKTTINSEPGVVLNVPFTFFYIT